MYLTRKIAAVLTATALIAGMGVAQADPPWMNGSEHGMHDKYEKKHKHHRDDNDGYHHGGPPPWAPAYGLRQEQDGYSDERQGHYSRDERDDRDNRDDSGINVVISDRDRDYNHVTAEIGINDGRCNRDKVGTLLGGLIGGVTAKKLADDSKDKKLAVIAGVVFGAMLGNKIGSDMDKLDIQCTGQVLERAKDGQMVRWQNDETGTKYRVSPYKTYEQDGHYCRKYETEIVDKGRISKLIGAACRNTDGSWQSMQ